MNTLTQHESLLVGSDEAVVLLSQETAREDVVQVLLVSDTHGHYDILEAILKKFALRCSAVLFAGDGCADIAECITHAYADTGFKKILPPVLAFVRGNGDAECYKVYTGGKGKESAFPLFVPERQVISVSSNRILLTHGHHYGVTYDVSRLLPALQAASCSVAVYGHTHVPFFEEYKGTLIINPGSCSRARDGKSETFAVLTMPNAGRWYDIQFYSIHHSLVGYKFEKYFV